VTLTKDLPLEVVRRCYAEDVRFRSGMQSEALCEAFASVSREHYLGPGPWQVVGQGGGTTEDDDPRQLYHDVLIAIDPAKHLNNGMPSALAGWLDSLQVKAGHRVLHTGCGLGYYTAILAHVVGSEGHVTGIEIEPALAARAKANLAHLANVTVIEADGVTYDPGPVDAIFINAGVTHPQPLWLDRLKPGGRLLVPLTVAPGGSGWMLLVHRVAGRYEASFSSMVMIYSSPSGRDPQRNATLARAFQETLQGKRPHLRSIRRDAHAADTTCWMHADDFCLSTLEGGL
jgi:protein-L-isoaspartate(D-aspartate) O-methyltransferase